MFLGKEYRNRGYGLVAAYAVLVAGIVINGTLDAAPAKDSPVIASVFAPMHATEASLDRSKTHPAGDCWATDECRPEIVC